jgi:hypothetical protein
MNFAYIISRFPPKRTLGVLKLQKEIKNGEKGSVVTQIMCIALNYSCLCVKIPFTFPIQRVGAIALKSNMAAVTMATVNVMTEICVHFLSLSSGHYSDDN